MKKNILRWAGLFIFFGILWLPAPEGMTPAAKTAAAAALLMGFYWITEALPLAATSLIPLALFPFLSILTPEQCARLYADPNIFLFMGGFMIALAMQKCGLDKRIALNLVSLVGTGPRRLLGGFLAATAAISLWVSNTATTLMMLPIALAVIHQFEKQGGQEEAKKQFGAVLMLGIAYASSIGGIGTLVGTPPNMIFAGQLKTLFPQYEMSFTQWFLMGVPTGAGFLLLTWIYLAFFAGRGMEKLTMQKDIIAQELAALGRWRPSEVRVLAIFIVTALAWIFRADIPMGSFRVHGWMNFFHLKEIHDGTVAMAAAVLLFMIPSGDKDEPLLTWPWAAKLPWDVLLLFGGGFALAESFQSTGLASWLARDFGALAQMPFFLVLLVLCFGTVFMSEFMSNSPQVTIMLPVLAAASESLSLHPYWLMIPATLMASLAFMMPAGTPPNAIVFSSGHVSMRKMALTGLVLNLLAVVWVSVTAYFLLPAVFGITHP